VVADGLGAEVQLLCDLPRRASSLEQPQHLALARGQLQVGMLVRLLHDLRDLLEDADHVLTVDERHRAHLDRDSVALKTEYDNAGVGYPRRADDLPREQLACAECLLRRDDGRELPPAHVPDEVPAGRVHPADHTGRVDDVARHVHMLEHVVELHRLEHGQRHGESLLHRDVASAVEDGVELGRDHCHAADEHE
jgi:hypothetical protein